MVSLLSQQPTVNLGQANDLALLYKMECRACPLNSNVGGKMAPTGALNPLVYILGDAPGAAEIEAKENFAGGAGRLLRAHIPRKFKELVRFNNCVRSRPLGGEPPDNTALACCRPSIVKDIEQSKPKVIIGLGNIPLNWVSGLSEVTLWRGRKMPVKIGNHVCWFYPLEHPTYLLRKRRSGVGSEEERMFVFDMRRVFAEIENLSPAQVHSPVVVRRGVEIITDGGIAGIERVKEALVWASRQQAVGLDFETNALRPYGDQAKILTIAVATGERAIAFPLDHPEAPWSVSERVQVCALWTDFLRESKSIKVVHNLAFELEWVAVKFGVDLVRAGRWEDTATQAAILDERKGKRKPGCFSLEFLVQQYFGINLKKLAGVDRKNLAETPVEAVLQYNAPDAKYHYLLWEKQTVAIKSLGLDGAYELALRSVPTVVLTQVKGLPVDQDEALRLRKKYELRIKEAEDSISVLPVIKEFQRKKGATFNPLSNSDVIFVFKDLLHRSEILVEDKYTKKKRYSADEKILEQIDHPLAKLLVQLRKVNKRKSTYIDPLIEGSAVLYPDKMLHAQFNTIFAETGRTSCVRGGTLIHVPGRSIPIEDVKVGDWVYAFDLEKKLVLRCVTNTWHRGKKSLLRVHWVGKGGQHAGYLDLTPDHRIRLTSGEYVEAGSLKGGKLRWSRKRMRWHGGEHVMALHRSVRGGRHTLYATFNQDFRESRFIFEQVNGWAPEHVHHADENPLNDKPNNLLGLTHKNHALLHAKKAMTAPGEAARRAFARSNEALERNKKAVVAAIKRRAATRFTKQEVLEALREGGSVRGACKILNCDQGTIRCRIDQWGITGWDGRSKNINRPWQHKARGPYKGHNTYVKGYSSPYVNNHMITHVEPLEGLHDVYDIEVDGVHNFIAGEICVHNCDAPNLQNFPKRDGEAKEVRKQIVPAPGCTVMAFDYGQLEARVIALFTKDARFCKSLWERYDVHMEWAERLAKAYPARIGGKKNLSDKKVMKDFRTDIKNQWTFPLFFGARLESAAAYLKIPENVIRPQYDEFWRQFSGVKAWQEGLLESYKELGYVEFLTGRRRHGPLSTNQIFNSPIQGTAAAIVLDAMSRLSEMGDLELQPEINIHDDLTFVRIPTSRVDVAADKIITAMLTIPFSWAKAIPFTVEGSFGPNWLEMEEFGTFSSDEWFK